MLCVNSTLTSFKGLENLEVALWTNIGIQHAMIQRNAQNLSLIVE